MLRITIELVPGGREHAKKTIATAEISNVSYLADVSDYVIEVDTKTCPNPRLPAWQSRGMIAGHDRRATVWALVAKAAAWAAKEAEKQT